MPREDGTPRTSALEGRHPKSFSFASPAGGSGLHYIAGFYMAPAADANLDQAGAVIAYGTANISYAAHAFLVAAAAGTVNAGSCSIVVSGTSIDDEGNRVGADSETIVPDITAMATDQYFETTKKWIGQITFTLTPAGAATYAADFNYGYCKYDDYWNLGFVVIGIEVVGRAGGNDAGFDVELLLHSDAGWTYNAGAFVPGGTVIAQLSTTHGAERQLDNGEPFAFKLDNLSQIVDGAGSEGFVVRVTTTANNAVEQMDTHVMARY